MGFVNSYMVFKASRLDEISKRVSVEREHVRAPLETSLEYYKVPLGTPKF